MRDIYIGPPLQAQIHRVTHEHMNEKAVGSKSLEKRHKRLTQAKDACDKLRNKRKNTPTDLEGGKWQFEKDQKDAGI